MHSSPTLPTLSAQEHIERLLSTVPDFPTPGILFRDLTPVFANPTAFRAITDDLAQRFAGFLDVVAGVEARGFLLAASVGYVASAGVVPIRKAGKLPGEVLTQSYDLEYGSAELEMHPAAYPGQRMLLLDDVLATGGTLAASIALAERAGYVVVGVAVVLELEGLGGRAMLDGREIVSLMTI
jgi:adenine phosphoribosyltransferase